MTDTAADANLTDVAVTQSMRLIKTLDPFASIEFTAHVPGWYVSASIEIAAEGMLICANPGYYAGPNEAVFRYLGNLQNLGSDQVIVTTSPRTHWRWAVNKFIRVEH